MLLQATHTHLYPGHRGQISGPARIADLRAGGACLVEFSDGSVTPATISKTATGWQLQTGAYRTAAGTDIPEKRWSVSLHEDGGRLSFRIRKGAPGPERKGL